MRKGYILVLAAFAMCLCFAFESCGRKVVPVGDLLFDSIQTNITEHLFSDEGKPACNVNLDLTFINASTDEKMKDSLNTLFISETLGKRYAMHTAQEALEAFNSDYVKSYRKDLEPMYQREIAEQGDNSASASWYSYFKYTKTSIDLYRKHLLAYRIYSEEYTGGAHSIYNTEILNVDLRTLKRISLSDIIVDERWDDLSDIIQKQLMHDNGVGNIEELEDLGYGATGKMQLAPADNFILRPGSITFLYNVYEIAPYVMGAIEVTVGFDSLGDLLNTEYMIVKELQSAD